MGETRCLRCGEEFHPTHVRWGIVYCADCLDHFRRLSNDLALLPDFIKYDGGERTDKVKRSIEP